MKISTSTICRGSAVLVKGTRHCVGLWSLFGWFKTSDFNLTSCFVLQVLCELQVAMLEKGIFPDDDVSREIMTPDVRDIEDESYRNLRDWYIYRDYMNGLEYVVHAFSHLKRKHGHPDDKRALRRRSARTWLF